MACYHPILLHAVPVQCQVRRAIALYECVCMCARTFIPGGRIVVAILPPVDVNFQHRRPSTSNGHLLLRRRREIHEGTSCYFKLVPDAPADLTLT